MFILDQNLTRKTNPRSAEIEGWRWGGREIMIFDENQKTTSCGFPEGMLNLDL